MKNTQALFLILAFAFVSFTINVAAQTKIESVTAKSASPYDDYKLHFALDADPSPEAVGFDDPKSYWKFSYELRFIENSQDALKKVGYSSAINNANESQSERIKRIARDNKTFNKAYKKYGIRAARGKISKEFLLTEENRDFEISVSLSDEIKNILAQSESQNSLPDFWLQMKGKIYSKTKSGLKFKEKIQQSYICPAKMIVKGKGEWMMNACGFYYEIKQENGKIVIGRTSRL